MPPEELPPDHRAARDHRHQGRQAQAARLRAWRVDLRRVRRPAAGGQMALPDRRVRPGQQVDRGAPPAHPHPSGTTAGRSSTGCAGRMSGRTAAQEQLGAAAPASPADRAGPAACRPDHPDAACAGARQDPTGAAGRIGGPTPRTITLAGEPCPQMPTGQDQRRIGGTTAHPATEDRRTTKSSERRVHWPYRRSLLSGLPEVLHVTLREPG